jgi:tetratricopeptide (TPR) repeat protein
VLTLLLAGTTIGAGWLWWQDRRVRHAISEIEAEMAAGRHGIAARRLTQLLASAPGCDQAAYLLGVCERTRRRNREAERAWARVTPGSSFSSRAISERLSLLIETGRFAIAEQLINEVAEDPRVNRTALRILLVPVFTQQGRLDDAQRLIEERWQHLHETGEEASELAVNLGRLSLELHWTPPPVEVVRAGLDRSAALAPDDDRVWLGQANLAIRTGSLDVAERLLNLCLERRPDDPSIWRARLNWAMAASRADVVRQAMAHPPAGESTPAQLIRIQAWLAARQGDRAAERQALDRLIAIDPGDLTALKRLAELARQDGQPDRTAELQRRLAEIDRQSTRYRKLYERNQPIRDAAEMGHLAEKLGRSFEARVFLSVAAAKSLHRDGARRDLERLSLLPASFANTGGTLAELVAADLDTSANQPEGRGHAGYKGRAEP